ncbi:MAG TPA: hypothetical protein VF916_12230 [Ktedonobacterales bacterium]
MPRSGPRCRRYLQGFQLTSISAVPDARTGNLGRCDYMGPRLQGPDGQWDREAVTAHGLIALAGALAHDRVVRTPMTIRPWYWIGRGGGDSDVADLMQWLTGLHGGDQAQIQTKFDQLRRRTEELFDPSSRAWAAVETLATVLCDRSTLSGQEATEIIQTALKEAGA